MNNTDAGRFWDDEEALDPARVARAAAEFTQAVAELKDFRRRHRQGRPLQVVPDLFRALKELRPLAGKKITPGQHVLLDWLIREIAGCGGCLSIDFTELSDEVQVSPTTLVRYARDYRDWGVLQVEARDGAGRFGVHSFSLPEATARAVLA